MKVLRRCSKTEVWNLLVGDFGLLELLAREDDARLQRLPIYEPLR